MLKWNGINLPRKAKEKKSWDLENCDVLRISALQAESLQKIDLLFPNREPLTEGFLNRD